MYSTSIRRSCNLLAYKLSGIKIVDPSHDHCATSPSLSLHLSSFAYSLNETWSMRLYWRLCIQPLASPFASCIDLWQALMKIVTKLNTSSKEL